MRLFRILNIIVFAIFLARPGLAYMEDYPPYKFKEGPPKHLKVKDLVEHDGEFKSGSIFIRLKKGNDWHAEFLIKDDNTIVVDSIPEFTLPMNVFQADLDHNGFKDFIVISWNMGAGLGSHEYTVDLYLKEKEGTYHKITYVTLDPTLGDFIDPNKDGKYKIVITGFYGGAKHNYFTYSIYEIKNYRLVNADDKFVGFPKFVWYTYKKNDRDAIDLTNEERQAHVKEKNDSIKYEMAK